MDYALHETTFSLSTEVPRPSRRGESGRVTILRVGSLVLDGSRELCLIRNISAGGVTAHVYSVLDVGRRLAIELRADQTIEGEVAWIDNSNIGIAFDEPIDVEEMLASQSLDQDCWQPRPPRVEIDRLATLRAGAIVHGVSTRDISQGGVKIETDQVFESGQPVVLTPDRFRPIQGVVRWYRDGLCGISFNEVVPFHELMRWLKGL